jgi:hypothetical protein
VTPAQEEAAKILHGHWAELRKGERMRESEIDEARTAYSLATADEQRAAFHAFKLRGIDLGDPPVATRARFTLGDDLPLLVDLRGWDNGRRWNGWAAPLVEADQLAAFASQIGEGMGEFTKIQVESDRLIITYNAHDPEAAETVVVEAQAVVCDDGVTRDLFDIGLGLIWETADIDDRRFRTSETDGVDFSTESMLEANGDDEETCELVSAMKPGDAIMTGGGASGVGWIECFTDDMTKRIARAKREIMVHITEGRVPADVDSFSALHDHVDANEYGGLCESDVDPETFPVNTLQNAVDAWLARGRK